MPIINTEQFENCWFDPTKWTEGEKSEYLRWLNSVSDTHPAKKHPLPWEGTVVEQQTVKE